MSTKVVEKESDTGFAILYLRTEKTYHGCSTVCILRGEKHIYVDINNTILCIPKLKRAPDYLRVTRSIRRFTNHKTEEILNYILNEMESLPRNSREIYDRLCDTIRTAVREYLEKGVVMKREVIIKDVHKLKVGSEAVLEEIDKDKMIKMVKTIGDVI